MADDESSQPLLPRVLNKRALTFDSDIEAQDNVADLTGHIPSLRARGRVLRQSTSLMDEQAPETTDVDIRVSFVEKLAEYPELSDARISRESLSKGRQKLLDILNGKDPEGGVREDLPCVMMFKGRPLTTAMVVHLAIWCCSKLCEPSLLELVLKFLPEREIYFRAVYELPSRKEGWACELQLDALHIAAGLGACGCVEVLIRHASLGCMSTTSPSYSPTSRAQGVKVDKTVRDYVNLFTVKHHWNLRNPADERADNFYTPLHEATAQGFVDVANLLLQRGAEGGITNSDGVTPLHFLSMQGCAGGLLTGMAGDLAQIRNAVQALQEAGGSLEARIPRKHYNPKWADKTPLQLAAADDSRFPRQMMGLLVPCLQDDSVAEPRFFADVAFLAALDAEAATDVVRELSTRASRNTSVLQRFRIDAQMDGRTDLLAGILFLAPEAGGLMLEMLVGDPIIKHVSKHNIPTRTSMYGFWKHLPMRCIYRGDAERRDNVLLPAWKFEPDKPFERQPKIQWHRWLLPETTGLAQRTDYVFNVNVSCVLLPNMLDLDMFMALGRVLRPQMKVFNKLPVQGMIYCLWNNLVEPIWLADLLFHLLELVVLMWWSLAWPVYGPRGTIKADEPLCWAVITAGCWREVSNVIVWCINGARKYAGHSDFTLRSLWHPLSGVSLSWILPKVAVTGLTLKFVSGARNALDESDLGEMEQVLLAMIVLLKAGQVIYSFRLCTGGAKIYAIFFSFLGGATREMICITFMIFGSFSLAFMVLANDKAAGWVIASSYRGLLFGDGDGFNNLGMDVEEKEYAHNDTVLMAFLVMGSFFFNIILLNLIIAVYGNEYDKVAGETPLLFLHGRSKMCVLYIQSCQVIEWCGPIVNNFIWGLAILAAIGGVASHARFEHETWEMSTSWLFAAAQILTMAALAQTNWYSVEGIAADGKDHFLWICHRDNINEDEGANEALQVGYFDDHLVRQRRYMDNRLNNLEAKLDAILQHLGESMG
mmetsp:Transcript_88576/g.185101  ORF Transcript_88576/g.185101 Transcript_88576/m.185101 type:complete len:993 (-) Transcript_88576:368-3346(-)|eukprot:CAMPEP_0206500814 /NCGR_PEP_ID=MMETSP0324_2-20121206/52871_1 /ASSEMBLY_ACC=CAM_ASM_000836 /TAXON_ID=2866 /ORGANISM="Crypthecodinium cohnii, Strain Seligo" /LENGTH=992 /DNA_ID=CAMNT_0053988379 /DNA_START=214 /DNA_END=3192 /DNA_ORIENTATION=+